ncbi:medium-chain fatty acid-CoA ligase faa2 [Coemansia erecta]|uniref:Medium-chain fatty acid-CoA ligase faa2 n=1 Tax=Coemansia erecta TaxID=147472 RepID=A0A9W8CSQ7_9FUNG|nr:medium-chain fatty acid-CoA ligase faa2 [Coemansia erecta]
MIKSFAVPNSESPGYSSTYRHPDYKDGTFNGKFADVTTLYEVFKAQVKNHPKENFLGARAYNPETNTFGGYEWLTTTDVDEMIDDYGSGLDQLFAKHAPDMNEETGQQPLGIFSNNRPEWILTELTAFRSNRYSVGISDKAGAKSAEFYISCSELEVLVCSMDKIPRLLERIEHTPKLKVIISMDKLDCSKPTLFTRAFNTETIEELKSKAASLNIVLTDIDQVIQMGRAKPTEPMLPKPSTYCTLSFSSGSTGTQKEAKGVYGMLSRFAYKSKLNRVSSGGGFKHALWDWLIFGKISQLFGDRLRLVITSAIGLNPDLQNFFRVALSCNVIQGYGQTETIGVCFIQKTDDIFTGNIGVPSPGFDIRLRSIPDMGYVATDPQCPRGELMIRSRGILSGYYKAPEKTAEAMDGEWLATGDIARLNPDGTLRIIDRMGNVIRTALGIYVELEPLEMIYGTHRLVDSMLIHGTLLAFDLVAIVVPNREAFVPWAQRIVGNNNTELAELCKDKRVADAMTGELRALGSRAKAPSKAVIGAVHLEPQAFGQIDREFLTLSSKLRRFKIVQHYEAVINDLSQKMGNDIDLQMKTSGSS